MSFLKKLLGGIVKEPKQTKVEAEAYNECLIYAEPMKDAAGYRIAARIEKEVGGEKKVHEMIRSDTFTDYDDAVAASTRKAKQVIDQLGDGIF